MVQGGKNGRTVDPGVCGFGGFIEPPVKKKKFFHKGEGSNGSWVQEKGGGVARMARKKEGRFCNCKTAWAQPDPKLGCIYNNVPRKKKKYL